MFSYHKDWLAKKYIFVPTATHVLIVFLLLSPAFKLRIEIPAFKLRIETN